MNRNTSLECSNTNHRLFIRIIIFAFVFLCLKSNEIFAQHLRVADVPQLTVEDFQGTVPKDAKYWAFTGTKILYRLDSIMYFDRDRVKLKFITKVDVAKKDNYFNLDKIPEEAIEKILNHEQGHVCIGFIVANKLEEILSNKVWSNDFRTEVREEYSVQIAKYSKLHEKYDQATNHGMDDEMQKKWDKELHLLLLNSYKK